LTVRSDIYAVHLINRFQLLYFICLFYANHKPNTIAPTIASAFIAHARSAQKNSLDFKIITTYILTIKQVNIRSFVMKTISVANDIVPIAEFKTSIAKWFKTLQNTGRPLIITQNGKPAGVVLSPNDYDDLVYRKSFLDSVDRGIADADSGKTYSTEEIRAKLTDIRSKK